MIIPAIYPGGTKAKPWKLVHDSDQYEHFFMAPLPRADRPTQGGVNIWHEVAEGQASSEDDQNSADGQDSKLAQNIFNVRVLIAAVYVVLGICLLSAFLVIVNVYVVHLKVETAVVSVPIESMVAPLPGFIREVFVLPGEKIRKGAVLIRMENIDLERELQLARIQVEDSRLNVLYYQNLLNNEHQKLQVYKNIGSSRLVSAVATVENARQLVITSGKNLSRMRLLHKKHYVSDVELDQEVDKYKNAEKNMKTAIAQRDIENDSLNAVGKGVYFTGNKLEGIERDLNAEIEAASKRLKLNQDRVRVYEGLLSRLTLVAPYDCKVVQVLKSAGTTTDNAKPIILLEKLQANRNIIAYLTQDEISHVGIGGAVKIYIPSIREKYTGRVLRIDRTEGFVDEIKAQYRWRDSQLDRSAMVTIEINQDNGIKNQIISGMPSS